MTIVYVMNIIMCGVHPLVFCMRPKKYLKVLSEFMFFSNKKKNIRDLDIKINGKKLEQCVSYKYLGVIFDKNLSWQPHVQYICGKISKACGALSKIRHSVDIETLKNVYYALVHSYLRYGVMAWGNANEKVLKPLHSLMNHIVRIINFALFKIGTGPIFDYLNFFKNDINISFGNMQICF